MNMCSLWFQCLYCVGIVVVFILLIIFSKWLHSKRTKMEKKEHGGTALKRSEIIIYSLCIALMLAQSSFYAYCAINPEIESFEGVYEKEKGRNFRRGGSKYYFNTGYGHRAISRVNAVIDEPLEEGKRYMIWYEGRSKYALKIEQIGG